MASMDTAKSAAPDLVCEIRPAIPKQPPNQPESDAPLCRRPGEPGAPVSPSGGAGANSCTNDSGIGLGSPQVPAGRIEAGGHVLAVDGGEGDADPVAGTAEGCWQRVPGEPADVQGLQRVAPELASRLPAVEDQAVE